MPNPLLARHLGGKLSTTDMISSPTLSAFSDELAAAIAQAAPAVVGIQSGRTSASGVHWRSGIIVTTPDAVRRREEVTLITTDGTLVSAQVKGQDAGTDIAILQAEGLELPIPEIGTLDALQPGHIVLAVGRDRDGVSRAGSGILSSVGGAWQSWTGGHIERLIRPDIAPFPSFSGSPLLDIRGQILGINTTYSRGRFAIAIPATTVDRVVNQLLQQGRVTRGYLGIGLQPIELMSNLKQLLDLAQETGILIASLEAAGPADRAGVLVGDILLALEDREITSAKQLQSQLGPEKVGRSIAAKLIRGGQLVELSITVGEQ